MLFLKTWVVVSKEKQAVSSCEILGKFRRQPAFVEKPVGFAHFGLELGRGVERELQEYMNICYFNSKWIRNSNSKWISGLKLGLV